MSALGLLLSAVRRLHERTPELVDYAPWPDDLTIGHLPANTIAATQTITTRSLRGSRLTSQVIKALRRAAPELDWRQTYTEQEVGARFLSDYGYVELFGPNGHFRSSKLRGYLGYWGPDLTYDWHDHEAEELYFTLAGQAVFSAKDASNATMRPGLARLHLSHQPHLMITLDQPYLAYVLWRGAGLDGLPRMVGA